MPASGYTPWSVVVGEQPTTTKWNILGANDAAFYSGNGINDTAILFRHLQTDVCPTGHIVAFGGSSSPSSNWLLCNGQAVSRTAYAALFAVIGTTYGTGDGSTTFNVPNASGRTLVGLSNVDTNFTALGQTGGEDSHVLSQAEMPVHSHGVSDPGHSHGSGANYWLDAGGSGTYNMNAGGNRYAQGLTPLYIVSNGTGISINNAGSGNAHNNLQPYITVNYLIKT